MGTAVTPCGGPPDPCKDLLQEILDFMAEIQRRYWDLRNDLGNLPATKPAQPDPRYGTRSIEGERQQFGDRQQGLRNRLNDWNTNGCGPPPAEAWDWATREAPAADPKPTDDTAKRVGEAAAATGAAVGVGYIIYRIVRFLPSLAPPLWWTIPENALIP
jgi:hypothetical protein